ncbi:MAG: AAA family ATPase [Betaproteobacteria bacterium]
MQASQQKPLGAMHQVSVIAMLGGECTGKTKLAQSLAHTLKLGYVPETLRLFVGEHQRSPRQDEQEAILMAQCDAIDKALCGLDRAPIGPVFICDSSPWMTAIYSLQYFGDAGLFAKAKHLMLDLAGTYRFRWLHFHCADDIAWQADGVQRDGPGQRALSRLLIEQYPPLQGAIGHDRVELLQGGFEQRLTLVRAMLARRCLD